MEKAHQEIRSTEAPLRKTIFASNAGANGLEPESSRPRGTSSSSSSASNNLLSILVRSLAKPRSERPYSPGR